MHLHALKSVLFLAVLLFATLIPNNAVQAFTPYREIWSGTSTTFLKSTSYSSYGGTGWNNVATSAAYDWTTNTSFDFVETTSVNIITVGSLPAGQLALTGRYVNNSTHQMDHFVTTVNIYGGYNFYDGTQAPDVPANYFDLRTVLRHELGHAAGLCHSHLGSSVLYPNVFIGPSGVRNISSDDVNGIDYLYNRNYFGPGPDYACDYYNSATFTSFGSGAYDDRNVSVFSYGGRADDWLGYDVPYYAVADTITRDDLASGRVNVRFAGYRTSIIYSTGPVRSTNVQVYIDGVFREAFNAYTPQYRRQIIRTYEVAPGDHKLEIRTISGSGGNFDIDAVSVDIPYVGAGTYDDTSSQFRYFQTGAWTQEPGVSGAYNSTQTTSIGYPLFFRFTFSGSKVRYYFSKAYNRGKALITIDGVDYGTIDMYSSTTLRNQYFESPNLGAGVHVIHVTNAGEKNPSSSNYVVDVDRIEVIP